MKVENCRENRKSFVKRGWYAVISVLLSLSLVIGMVSVLGETVPAKAGNSMIRNAKIEWVTQDSPADGQANRLFIREHGSDRDINMQFKIEVTLTGQERHEPGTVRILIPKQIWHQRSSYYADGEVMAEGYGGMTFSVPDKVSESSAWHWEEAEDGQYVIINDASIDAAYQLSVQCTITGIRASKIVDMLPSDPLKATVEVTNRSGVKDTMSTQELTAVIDTREKLSDTGAGISGTVYSSPENVPESMKENLPGGSRNANNYVYVCWRTWPLYEGTQYFSLDLDLWAGLAEGNGTSIAGIILGEGGNVSGGTVGTETSGDQAGEHYSRQTLKYNFDTNGTNDTHSRNIWVAYPTAQMQGNKTYTIHAASQWTLTEADPKRESDSKEESCADAAASVSYTHSGWEYPAGLFGVYEYSGSQPGHTHSTTIKDRPEGSTSTLGHKKDKTYEMAIGALRNNKSVTLEYEVLTTGYGYSYTAGPTSEVPDLPENWEQDTSHYLNWTYKMETTDDTISVANISHGGTLSAGDYRFESITIAAPEMFSYGRQSQDIYQIPGTEFGYKPDNSISKPDVEVWIEKNKSGSWELYTTVQINSGTRTITFSENDNVTGYRTVIATNQAACKLAVWPKVTILPSDHVMQLVEERLQDYTNVVMKNEARQVTTFYWSAERQDEVLPEQTAWLEANGVYTTESSDDSLSTMTSAGFKVYGAMPSTGDYSYSRVQNDLVKRRVVVTLYAAVYEQSNLTDENKYNEAVTVGAITPETSGTWYLLLPKYFEPNTSTIQLRSHDRVTDVQVIDNYRGSGRTMVIVRASLTPDPKKLTGNTQANNCYGDKPQITMDIYVPWSDYNKIQNGYAVYHAAFESGNTGRLGNLTDSDYYQTIGYPDVWPGTPNTYLYSISDSQIRGLMSDLDPDSDEERFVYMRCQENIRNVDLSEQVELRIDARAKQGDTWGRGIRNENQVTVTEGENYTYRLTVASKQDSQTGGILIYDAIEAYVPHEGYDQDDVNGKKAWSGDWQDKGQWKGRLISVDLSELYDLGCAAKLYYSTTPRLVFDNNIDTSLNGYVDFGNPAWSSDYRLTDDTIWKEVTGSLENGVWTVPDALLGKVTAIAVDAQRDNNDNAAIAYNLGKGKSVSVYLNMKAPTDNPETDTWSAKGAYDHIRDNATTVDDIDWTGAGDPANNMYAYNEATVLVIPYSDNTSQNPDGQPQPRTQLNSAYTRVGIVPEVISVRKTWDDGESVNGQYMENRDGLRPDSVTVRLKGQTNDPASPIIEQFITLNAENGWKGVFQNAPDKDNNGNVYTYTVTEDPVPGYTTGVYREIGRSYEIVSTHKKETITLTGEILWLNPDGTAEETTASRVTLSYRRITSNGPEMNTHSMTVDKDSTNRWIYTFKDLDRYEPGGFEYKYILLENNLPEGWFAQNETAPVGVTVTAEYDPEDITTFRNFKKPDYGYAMIYSILDDASKPKDGNTAVPTFTFKVDLEKDNAPLIGEYEYILYDKAPQYMNTTTLPEGTSQIGSGTIRNGGTLTLSPDQSIVIIGIPSGTNCTVTETMGAGWQSNQRNDRVTGTIQTGQTNIFYFKNTYTAKCAIVITGTKRLRGREQKAKEFAFNLTDNNEFNDYGFENNSYGQVIATVKTGESRGTVTETDGTKTGLALFTFHASYDGDSTYTMHEYGGKKILRYKVEEALPAGAQVNPDGSVSYSNVLYDTSWKDVMVTITDNGDGTLKITATPLVFTNTYTLRKDITLTAHLTLDGRELQPNEFSFEVRRSGAPADSTPIATGKNDADGNIIFTPAITLTERDLAAISPDTGIGNIKFLISEVQGTDTTVGYMTTTVEAVVQISQKSDVEIVAALPGQEIKYAEENCTICGGTGQAHGLKAIYFNMFSNPYTYNGNPFELVLAMDDTAIGVCQACGGSGYDPDHPGQSCSECNGNAVNLGTEPIGLPNEYVLVPMGGNVPLNTLSTYGLDYSFISSTSAWAAACLVIPTNEWTGTLNSEAYSYTALVYYGGVKSSNGECTTCHGTGKVKGEPFAYGVAEPIQLTNHVHKFNYSIGESTDVLKANCSYTGCGVFENLTLKINKPTQTVFGGEGSNKATLTGLDNFNNVTGLSINENQIVYKGQGNTVYDGSNTAPVNPGTYIASLTLNTQKVTDNPITISVEYTIGKADISSNTDLPAVTMEDYTYGGAVANPGIINYYGTDVKYYINKTDSNQNGTEWKDMTGTSLDAGDYYIYAEIPEKVQYKAYTTATKKFTVKKAQNPVTVITEAYVMVDGHEADLSACISNNQGTVTFTIDTDSTNGGCIVNRNSGLFTSGSNTGTCTVTVNVEGNDNYEPVQAYITVNVTDKEIQNPKFENSIVEKTFGDESFKNPVSDAKGDVAYTVLSGGDIVTVADDGTVTILKAGTAVIKATAAETDTYASASVSFTLNVASKTVNNPEIILSENIYTYDGNEKKPTVELKDGDKTISSDEYTVSYSDNKNAGTAKIVTHPIQLRKRLVSGAVFYERTGSLLLASQ